MTTVEDTGLPASGAPAAAPPAGEPTRWSMLSDHLNPIVVREVQQALKGRAFSLSVLGAAIAVVLIALVVAADYDVYTSGRHAFDAGLMVLVPLLLFVVPMGAYRSMRLELRGGILEQLLLSELRPGRIVVGKLAAGMVQFALYLAVISPLLATSYLLNGVDVPTLLLSLLFAALFCLCAVAFGISSAAQAILPAMQGFASLAVALGLGIGCAMLMGFVGSGAFARSLSWLVRSDYLWTTVSAIALGSLLSCLLSGLTAAVFLAHAHENKSTGFRVTLAAIVAIAYGWILAFVPAGDRDEAIVVGAVALLIGSTIAAVFYVTEQDVLSPRVRAHVPKNALLAVLAAPFLPGRHRGYLAYLLQVAWIAAFAFLLWPAAGRMPTEGEHFAIGVACYGVIYLALGKAVRGLLPASTQGNHLGRFAVPFLIFLFCVLPVMFDVLTGGVHQWHIGHVLNPFWTLAEIVDRHRHIATLQGLGILAGIALLLQVRSLVGGVTEVLAAARNRREARPPAESADG